jgi:hypothetical protein
LLGAAVPVDLSAELGASTASPRSAGAFHRRTSGSAEGTVEAIVACSCRVPPLGTDSLGALRPGTQ